MKIKREEIEKLIEENKLTRCFECGEWYDAYEEHECAAGEDDDHGVEMEFEVWLPLPGDE